MCCTFPLPPSIFLEPFTRFRIFFNLRLEIDLNGLRNMLASFFNVVWSFNLQVREVPFIL